MARKVLAPQRREQIVQALFDCLAEKGHETVTIKDIARKAGLHYGVIHYYFASKDDILSAMAERIVAKYGRLFRERVKSANRASQKLRVALGFLVDEFIFNRRLNRVFYNLVQMAFQREAVRVALRKQIRQYRGLVVELVQEGIERGEFTCRNPKETPPLVVALVEGMALQWMIEPRALARSEVLDLLTHTVEGHLGRA